MVILMRARRPITMSIRQGLRLLGCFTISMQRKIQESLSRGWHVPSDSEWSELTTALGGAEVAGNAMKMTVGWGDSDSGTNTSGFGGLPGGNRGAQGEFTGGDLYGDWWTTDLTASTAWLRNLYRNRASVDRYPAATLRGGLSIRCIKDAE